MTPHERNTNGTLIIVGSFASVLSIRHISTTYKVEGECTVQTRCTLVKDHLSFGQFTSLSESGSQVYARHEYPSGLDINGSKSCMLAVLYEKSQE